MRGAEGAAAARARLGGPGSSWEPVIFVYFSLIFPGVVGQDGFG